MGGFILNVAVMTDSFPPMVDGVSRCALGYAKSLHEGGFGNIMVVAPWQPGVKYAYPFPVYCFNSLGVGYHDFRAGHPFIPKLMAMMQKLDIDIIHAHSPFIAMTVARQLRQFLKIPIVFTQHTKWDYDIAEAVPVKSVARNIERFVYNNINAADDVWAVSWQTGEYLLERGYRGDYIVMPNGTDFPKGDVDDALLHDLNSRFDLPVGVPVLLFVGRMMWYKNIRLTIEALDILRRRGFVFRMIFVGDGEDFAAINKLVVDLGLSDFVHFAGRVDDREVLRGFYSRSDLFVFPSVYDTAGLVVVEAAACGCPSLVVRGSSAAEIIKNGVSGFYSELSPSSIADSIFAIFGDRDRLLRVSLVASEELYTPWCVVAERSVERYRVVKDDFDISRRIKKLMVLKKRVKRLKALGIDPPRFR
jgi:glycosyltransferase involved in cell wall biosynthesis